jgi:hypothetical protein
MRGYPYLPTKTLGGDDPEMELPRTLDTLGCTMYFTEIGQKVRPHNILAPLQLRHRDAGIFIVALTCI